MLIVNIFAYETFLESCTFRYLVTLNLNKGANMKILHLTVLTNWIIALGGFILCILTEFFCFNYGKLSVFVCVLCYWYNWWIFTRLFAVRAFANPIFKLQNSEKVITLRAKKVKRSCKTLVSTFWSLKLGQNAVFHMFLRYSRVSIYGTRLLFYYINV